MMSVLRQRVRVIRSVLMSSVPTTAPATLATSSAKISGLVRVSYDEYSAPVSPCDQVCTNVEGTYYCSCNTGYILDKDIRSCDCKLR